MRRSLLSSGLLLGSLMLSGCGLTGGDDVAPVLGVGAGMPSSIQASVSAADAQALAAAVVNVVTQRVSASSGPLHLVEASGDAVMAPALASDLRASGYTLAAPGAARHRLAYSVGTLSSGLLVRLELDGARAARLFSRGRGGQLTAQGPFSVMEVSAK